MNRSHFCTITTLVLTAIVAPTDINTAHAADVAERAQEAAEPALFEDIHVVPLPVRNYGYRGMPGGMIVLKDGRILLGYTRMTPEGKADGSVAGRYSSDKGKTWGDEFILVKTPLGRGRVCHPSFVRLPNDEILMSYIYSTNTKRLYGHNYYRRSNDETATWSDQLIMTPRPGYNIMHNDKFLVLSTGRVMGAVEIEFSNPENDHGGYISYTVYSDNDGHNWYRSENDVNALPVEAQEPQVVELKDGRLMMLMRTYSGYAIRSYSDDQGETWSKHEDVRELKLPSYTSSALSVKRIPSTGDLLVLRCSGGPKEPYRWRTPFVSVISRDDGQTWEHERAIGDDPENDYGYPSLTFIDDMALISYHQRDGLHVARIGIDWFYGR